VLGVARFLADDLALEAVAAILVEDGLTTSAIEGERLDPASVRSSVARRLGLSTAGLPVPPRAVDGLVDVLLDATRHHDSPLTIERLFSLSAQVLREREGYYAVLEQAQHSRLEVTDWLAWFMEQVEPAAVCAEAAVSNILAKARFRLQHQATALSQRQCKVLDRCIWPPAFTTAHTCGQTPAPTTTGDYPSSLRSPWRAAFAC